MGKLHPVYSVLGVSRAAVSRFVERADTVVGLPAAVSVSDDAAEGSARVRWEVPP